MTEFLNYYFEEQLHRYLTDNQFERGKVYSDPFAHAFQSLTEAKVKKLRIFDFDDTLAKVKSNIIVKNKDKEFILTPAEFAVYNPKQGDSFNFKEFNQMIKTAIPIKSNLKLLKQAAEDPSIKTTILTARLLGYPVKHYLKKNFNLDIYIVAVGGSDPNLKVNYIEKEIKKGYNDIVFIDDSYKNVKAVEALQAKYPQVDLKVIHTTEAEHLNF